MPDKDPKEIVDETKELMESKDLKPEDFMKLQGNLDAIRDDPKVRQEFDRQRQERRGERSDTDNTFLRNHRSSRKFF